MVSQGTTSNRHDLLVPGDGQDEPADDKTQARNVSNVSNENWGDLVQTLLLDDAYIDGKLVGSGTLSSRGSAGTSAPKLYVVTDGGDSGDQPYLTYNDDSDWHLADQLAFRTSITDADSPYSISEGETVWVDASSATVQVDLPAPSDNLAVRVVVTDATNNVTISRNGSEDIDGSASDLTIQNQRDVTLLSDGTNWRLVADTWGTIADIAGSGLKEDGNNLLTVEPTDFAGTSLSDDGSDNLQVDIDRGLTTDGSQNIETDIGNGLEFNTGTVRVNPAGIAGDGLKEGSATALAVEPADFAGEGLEDDGSDNLKVKEPFAYDPGMTEWADGLSNEEIDRIALQSSETLAIERIEFRQKGGGSSASASIDVRDTTAGTTIGSQDLGGTTKDPGSSGSGNTVIVRVTNSTGSGINASPRVVGYIEGA